MTKEQFQRLLCDPHTTGQLSAWLDEDERLRHQQRREDNERLVTEYLRRIWREDAEGR